MKYSDKCLPIRKPIVLSIGESIEKPKKIPKTGLEWIGKCFKGFKLLENLRMNFEK